MNLLFETPGIWKGLGQHAFSFLLLLPVRTHVPSWENAQTHLSCLRKAGFGASFGLGNKVVEKHAFPLER